MKLVVLLKHGEAEEIGGIAKLVIHVVALPCAQTAGRQKSQHPCAVCTVQCVIPAVRSHFRNSSSTHKAGSPRSPPLPRGSQQRQDVMFRCRRGHRGWTVTMPWHSALAHVRGIRLGTRPLHPVSMCAGLPPVTSSPHVTRGEGSAADSARRGVPFPERNPRNSLPPILSTSPSPPVRP